MTATNHTLTGALIGLTVNQPILAIALALFSHFILDALPHYGAPDHVGKSFKRMLMADASVAFMVLLGMAIVRPEAWPLAIICGVAAASPDLMWLPRWVNELRGRKNKPLGPIAKFHANIQWAEKTYNWPYEVVWFAVSLLTLAKVV